MNNLNRIEVPECQSVRALLSDYMENALSARDTWSVDKHLTGCTDCSQFLQEMKTTIALLHAAPPRDTADDFMARLHARLDNLEPEAMRPASRLTAFRDWFADLRDAARNPRIPALGLSFSAIALVTLAAISQFAPKPMPSANHDANAGTNSTVVTKPTAASVQSLRRNAAINTHDSFGDGDVADFESSLAENSGSAADSEDSGS